MLYESKDIEKYDLESRRVSKEHEEAHSQVEAEELRKVTDTGHEGSGFESFSQGRGLSGGIWRFPQVISHQSGVDESEGDCNESEKGTCEVATQVIFQVLHIDES